MRTLDYLCGYEEHEARDLHLNAIAKNLSGYMSAVSVNAKGKALDTALHHGRILDTHYPLPDTIRETIPDTHLDASISSEVDDFRLRRDLTTQVIAYYAAFPPEDPDNRAYKERLADLYFLRARAQADVGSLTTDYRKVQLEAAKNDLQRATEHTNDSDLKDRISGFEKVLTEEIGKV